MLSLRSSLCHLSKRSRYAPSLGSPQIFNTPNLHRDEGTYYTNCNRRPLEMTVRTIKTNKSVARTLAVRTRMRAAMLRYRKPQLLQAIQMPLSPQEMDNSTLVVLAELGQHNARTEMLKRHIMGKDQVNYDQAHAQYKIISAKNKENMYLLSLPYHFGILVSVSAGLLSIPMVFDLNTTLWFNNNFVTADIPDNQDLETILEVGAWAWNWMEPPLGTISFLLLTLQFSRSQLQNLGAKPYTARVKQWRGERLAQAFPQYDAKIIMDYSETSSIQATRKEIN